MSGSLSPLPGGSPLHPVVHQKFREAFGEPHRVVGKDMHWGLKALPYMATINVLVNGSSDYPIVWVFDPHDSNDGVLHTAIRDESEIDEVVRRIEDRIRTAARPNR